MRKLVAITILLITVMLIGVNTENVHAQVTQPPYSYEYSATNFYNVYPLTYEISGLDASELYLWSIYTVDEETGQNLKILGSVLHTGATTDTWSFGVGDGNGSWPENFTGPVRVQDNFGATLGTHYIANFPFVDGDVTNNEWYATGNQALYEKVLIGNRNRPGGGCQSIIHEPINSDGWIHSGNACQSATYGGDYALIHFQIDYLSYSAPTTDSLVIFQLQNGAYAQTVAIDLDDLVDYQVTSGYSGGLTAISGISFVLVNTSEEPLPFVDYERADDNFTSIPATNPLRFGSIDFYDTSEPWGAYTCGWYQGATVVGECESVWIVTENPDLNEFEIEVQSPEIGIGGAQIADVRQWSLGVWNTYHGTFEVTDSGVGLIDDTIYSFVNLLGFEYTVSTTAGAGYSVTFEITPNVWPSGFTATTDEMYFQAVDTYTITNNATLEQSVSKLVAASGFDTEAGRTVLHALIIMFGLVTIAIFPILRFNFGAYTFAFTVFGGMCVLVPSLHSDLSVLMWILSSIIFWILTFTLFRGSFSTAGSEQ